MHYSLLTGKEKDKRKSRMVKDEDFTGRGRSESPRSPQLRTGAIALKERFSAKVQFVLFFHDFHEKSRIFIFFNVILQILDDGRAGW